MAELLVERVGPLVTVQDHGRIGVAHAGVPRSGPLDERTMAAAIAAVGGDRDDATIEIPLVGATLRAVGRVLASIDGEPARTFEDGAMIEVARGPSAVRYLAVAGGIDVPRVLGSRATHVSSSMGGFEGRALRRGDRLVVAEASRDVRPPLPHASSDVLGVLGDEALIEVLIDPRREWTIDARSDRVGTRLLGLPIALDLPRDRPSRPIVRGAVQLPPDGLPIVIGPDGPTTGGYPVLGVLDRAGCARLARIRPGGSVRFADARNSVAAGGPWHGRPSR